MFFERKFSSGHDFLEHWTGQQSFCVLGLREDASWLCTVLRSVGDVIFSIRKYGLSQSKFAAVCQSKILRLSRTCWVKTTPTLFLEMQNGTWKYWNVCIDKLTRLFATSSDYVTGSIPKESWIFIRKLDLGSKYLREKITNRWNCLKIYKYENERFPDRLSNFALLFMPKCRSHFRYFDLLDLSTNFVYQN